MDGFAGDGWGCDVGGDDEGCRYSAMRGDCNVLAGVCAGAGAGTGTGVVAGEDDN